MVVTVGLEARGLGERPLRLSDLDDLNSDPPTLGHNILQVDHDGYETLFLDDSCVTCARATITHTIF